MPTPRTRRSPCGWCHPLLDHRVCDLQRIGDDRADRKLALRLGKLGKLPLVAAEAGIPGPRCRRDKRGQAAVQSGRIVPATPSNAASASSHTSSRAGSTGPGMVARPLGMRLKPAFP